MKQFYTYFFFLFLFVSPILAQQPDPVIATVNNKPIYLSEFEAAYTKNTSDYQYEKESKAEFFKKYIDFKLNVEEAYAQQLDTIENYKYQYAIFRSSLIKPYLSEENFQNNYIAGFYDRMREDLNINHAFIPFDNKTEGISKIIPAVDTLKAYRKALDVRKNLLSNGFKGNTYIDHTQNPDMVFDLNQANGYLGWITPFTLNQQTTNAAYNLQINEISQPIRSSTGYHIIQVLGKRPAIGDRIVEQVVFNYPTIPPNKQEADSVLQVAKRIRESLGSQLTFDALCKAYLDANELEKKDCIFNQISLDSKLPPAFISAAFSLKNKGDISNAVPTMFGVHILQLKEIKPLVAFENIKNDLFRKIAQSEYSYHMTTDLQKHLFSKYGLKVNQQTYKNLTDVAGKINPETPEFITEFANNHDILFTIEDSLHYPVNKFITFLEEEVKNTLSGEDLQLKQMMGEEAPNPYTLSTDRLQYYLNQYAAKRLYENVTATMEKRQPEVRLKLQEFSDGLLLYAVKEKNLWNKPINEAELEALYLKNKKKYNWDNPRYKGFIILSADKGTHERVDKLLKKVSLSTEIQPILQREFGENWKEKIKLYKGLWRKGANNYIDRMVFNIKTDITDIDTKYPYSSIFGKLLKSPETLNDIKGEVEADYLEQQEAKWQDHLRQKYRIVINQQP